MPLGPIEELRNRLDRHGSRVAKVTSNRNPHGGGGRRTLISLFDRSGARIEAPSRSAGGGAT